MSREWQPGDVAIRRGADGRESLAICADDCRQHGVAAGLHWHTYRDGRPDWDTLAYRAVTYRPLAVIDYGDREQVERLVENMMRAKVWAVIPESVEALGAYRAGQLQAALREFADPKPPKPDEPTGLGAVVETSDGRRYVRTAASVIPWLDADDRETGYEYADLDAVEILSEGVTP